MTLTFKSITTALLVLFVWAVGSIELIDTFKNNPSNIIIITERSIETDRNVFAKMLYEDNLISSIT